MSRPNLQLRIAPSAPLGYGLAILSVAIASGFAFPAQTLHVHDVAGPICLIGIAVTAWYAGSGPALLAVVISITFFDYFFVEPHYSLTTTLADLLYLIIFIAFASLVAWFTAVRRRVERDLRDARDYLYSRGKYQSRSSDNPAVILLDLKLPKVDGLEVLKQIKSDAKLKMISVVVLRERHGHQLQAGCERLRRQTRRFPRIRQRHQGTWRFLGRHQSTSAR
jgi:CheY-like chemotaxis protein